jgi:hypothetical protein
MQLSGLGPRPSATRVHLGKYVTRLSTLVGPRNDWSQIPKGKALSLLGEL